jgi:hypothetical protein
MPDRTVTAALPAASRPPAAGVPLPSSRSAATNRPASRWNSNTASGRRCRDLYKSYLKQAGSPTEPAAQAAVMALAEQIVIAEQARSACLADGGMTKLNLELVIRAENLANRTLKRLKLDKLDSKRTGPSLDDIKARYSASAAPTNGEAS